MMKNSITALTVYKFHVIVPATGMDKEALSHDNLERRHGFGGVWCMSAPGSSR